MSSCCENYICRLCIGWQAKKAKKDEDYKIVCSHCYMAEFRLNDVDESDANQLKYYTDTPIRCRMILDQNSFKEALENSTVRQHQENLTPYGDDRYSVRQSEEHIVTPKEFSKHLISSDKAVKILGTEAEHEMDFDERHQI